MTNRATLTIDDLPAETRKKHGLSKSRQTQFTKEEVRQHALRVLAEINGLTQDQRRRVLEHASKVNNV